MNGTESGGDWTRVSKAFEDAYWEEFCSLGPRHRNVCRWMKLGWRIEADVIADYLSVEVH